MGRSARTILHLGDMRSLMAKGSRESGKTADYIDAVIEQVRES